jgi:hypothetical protein
MSQSYNGASKEIIEIQEKTLETKEPVEVYFSKISSDDVID